MRTLCISVVKVSSKMEARERLFAVATTLRDSPFGVATQNVKCPYR